MLGLMLSLVVAVTGAGLNKKEIEDLKVRYQKITLSQWVEIERLMRTYEHISASQWDGIVQHYEKHMADINETEFRKPLQFMDDHKGVYNQLHKKGENQLHKKGEMTYEEAKTIQMLLDKGKITYVQATNIVLKMEKDKISQVKLATHQFLRELDTHEVLRELDTHKVSQVKLAEMLEKVNTVQDAFQMLLKALKIEELLGTFTIQEQSDTIQTLLGKFTTQQKLATIQQLMNTFKSYKHMQAFTTQ